MQTRLTKCWLPIRRMHLERAAAALCVSGFALGSSHTAFAQSVRIAVIHAAQQDEAARRLRAEVAAAGLDVVDVLVSALEGRSTGEIASAAGAVAALRAGPGGDIEVVVIDSDTGNALDRVLLPEEPSTALEVRAVEDLRAKLVELSISLPANSDAARGARESMPTPSRPDAPRLAAQHEPRIGDMRVDTANDESRAETRGDAVRRRGALAVWIQAAAGGAISSGGLGENAITRFGVRVEPFERWSLSALTMLPLSGGKIATARGSANVNEYLFGATIGVVPVRSQTVDLELALGGGVALCTMSGSPVSAGDTGRSLAVWSGVGVGEVSFAWGISDWLRVRAAAFAGVAAPRPTVSFGGEPVATWGRPFAMGTVGLELEPLFAARGGS